MWSPSFQVTFHSSQTQNLPGSPVPPTAHASKISPKDKAKFPHKSTYHPGPDLVSRTALVSTRWLVLLSPTL